MSGLEEHKSGKGERDENFPVGSALIAPRNRAVVLAYYRFARSADDAADHATMSRDEKFARMDGLEATLLGRSDAAADALPLRAELAKRGMSPRHALDLLVAFRQDVTKTRYANWDELIEYCRYSANPVGRFVLEVHGESADTFPSNDALCTALQVINHVQDCKKDYRDIDRVYIPLDMLGAEGLGVEALSQSKATPALRRVLGKVVAKTIGLMPLASTLPQHVADTRLACETAVIAKLAAKLLSILQVRDPLSERVHLSKPTALGIASRAVVSHLMWRAFNRAPVAALQGRDAR